ncbi:hypothetical protein ABS798_01855, partial [Mycoplasmopsis bovis]
IDSLIGIIMSECSRNLITKLHMNCEWSFVKNKNLRSTFVVLVYLKAFFILQVLMPKVAGHII